MSTVKNNEQTAATDQQKVETAKRIATINIVSSLVAKNNIDIDTIPNLFRRVDGLFEAGMYANSLELAAPAATQTAIPAPSQPAAVQQTAPVAQAAPAKRGRKPKVQTEQSAETVAEAAAPVADAPAGKKRGRKAAASKTEAAPVVEAPAAEAPRPRGRPRKLEEKLIKGQFTVPYDPSVSQEENDARFLAKYPPIMSVEESLEPVGDRGQMRLIFAQKPVSFIATHLGRYYDRNFEDYKRIYNLPADYPEKPPAYVTKMRGLASSVGLGTTLPKTKATVEEEQAAQAPAPKVKRAPKATPQRKAEDVVAEAQADAPKAAPGERKRKTRNIEAQAA